MKPLDVIEHIGPGFGSGLIDPSIDTLSFQETKETLHRRIVGTAPDSTHAADQVVTVQEALVLSAGELAPTVGGFLLTQVEREGDMGGFNLELVERAVNAAGDARLTAAGGITTAREIALLDKLGADAQVGMAIYSGRLSLGEALGAPLERGIDGRLWPTVVCDENGTTLGLVWSTRESLNAAVEQRRGIYWSRSRNELWIKGIVIVGKGVLVSPVGLGSHDFNG